MKGILQDIRTGALPAEEIPGFIAWGIRKLFWFFFAIILVGGGILLLK